MKKDLTKGTICSILSAIVFGLTPVFARWSFDLGSNAMTLTFYRNAMVVPVMLIILLIRKVDLRITRSQFIQLALISIFFSATTTFLLYASYVYIGIGLATTLHFLYPVFTVFFGFIFFKNKMENNRIVALVLAIIGIIVATSSSTSFGFIGIVLAIASSITYASYMLAIEKSVIKDMDSMKAMFYMCIFISIVIALIDIPIGEIKYDLQFKALAYTFIVAFSNSLIAYVLLIIGIRLIGSGNAAIFSTLEPVSGVICGIFILGEAVKPLKVLSCILIIIAVTIPIMCDYKKSKKITIELNE